MDVILPPAPSRPASAQVVGPDLADATVVQPGPGPVFVRVDGQRVGPVVGQDAANLALGEVVWVQRSRRGAVVLIQRTGA